MRSIALFVRKTALALLMTVIGLSVFPFGAVYAAGLTDIPELGKAIINRPRLEWVFELQQERYAHQTEVLDRIPTLMERIQGLIDRATGKGLDASSVQNALDNFAAAVPAAQAAHDRAGALIATHAGFDERGKVTDLPAALQTVTDIHRENQAFRDALLPPFRALRQAIRTFVQHNNLHQFQAATPTP